MNFLLTLLTGLTCFSAVTSQGCSRIVTRREIRDLSDYERNAFFNAVRQLHYNNNNVFEGFSIWHQDYNSLAHNVPALLPWHRWLIYTFETNLQRIDPNVVLPYWDWTRDYRAPERSVIFSDWYLGGNGRQGDRCVVDGAFANFNMVTPDNHCLRRDFENGSRIPPFAAPEIIEAIINNTDSYDEFRRLLEYPPHALVHNGIGGRAGDMSKMYAPNDPIFYLHHAFVDLIWSEWQTRHPNMANTYNGGRVRSSDAMPPFNAQVYNTFSTAGLCYRYPRFSARLPRVRKTSIQNSSKVNKSIQFNTLQKSNVTMSSPFSKLNSFIDELHQLPKPKSAPTSDNDDTKIPHLEPVPESYIREMNMDLDEVRANEKIIERLVDALNSVHGFQPSVSET